IVLAKPLVLSDTTQVTTLNVVINGLQWFHANVNNGVVTLGWPGTNFKDQFTPDIVGSGGSLAGIEFYASTPLGTAGSYCAGCVVMPRVAAVIVYYTSASTPSMVSLTPGGTTTACNPFAAVGTFLNDPTKSYLGLDANGNLA